MLVAYICTDKVDSLETRLRNRPAHLEWLASNPGILVAGPLLDGDQKPCGSLLIVEHESLERAREWGEQDPYVRAKLFENVVIREWVKVIGN